MQLQLSRATSPLYSPPALCLKRAPCQCFKLVCILHLIKWKSYIPTFLIANDIDCEVPGKSNLSIDGTHTNKMRPRGTFLGNISAGCIMNTEQYQRCRKEGGMNLKCHQTFQPRSTPAPSLCCDLGIQVQERPSISNFSISTWIQNPQRQIGTMIWAMACVHIF